MSISVFAEPPKTSCDDLRRLQFLHEPGLVLIDVRSPSDFAQGHIQGAKNIPSQIIQTAGLPRDGRLVVYCDENSCPLSRSAAERLIADSYTNVSYLDGGLAAWRAKRYPIVKGNDKPRRQRNSKTRASELQRRLSTGAWAIDVRPAVEYQAGHLPGAKNFPLETLDADLVRLPKDTELVVYDRKADRSRQAMDKLTGAGLKAKELSGGLKAWARRRMPLEFK